MDSRTWLTLRDELGARVVRGITAEGQPQITRRLDAIGYRCGLTTAPFGYPPYSSVFGSRRSTVGELR